MSSGRLSTGVKKVIVSKITKAQPILEPSPPSPLPVPSKLSLQPLYTRSPSSLSSLQTWSHNYNREVEAGSEQSLCLRVDLEAREKESNAVRKGLNDFALRIGGEGSGVDGKVRRNVKVGW
ncbi:hypothetical protein JAAARDRAFT_39334 [Jaapia argillacea MUCL 33604]|uniref:Uncharacterized protein n=1 Tax=Jaapia argillacea MUCL 33604 TaxID=933084 RepID=A0A067PSH0_9AGAM|nr:hypothetical protein JAAARDRAFT_39334 [Jaapia argillacea MUCL 33604]